MDWFGTVRGRIGYAFGNTLVYGTGGFAAGGVRMTFIILDNNIGGLGGSGANASASRQSFELGYQYRLGRGRRRGVKLSPSWSLKGEYQYVDLGTISAGPGEIVIPAAARPGLQLLTACHAV